MDFKDFIARYGSGTVGGVITLLNPMNVPWTGAPCTTSLAPTLSQMLEVLNPFGEPREAWLYGLASTLAVCDPFHSIQLPHQKQSVRTHLWPELPGLRPWGRGDAGQALLWWVDAAADPWPVVLADPTEGLRAYDTTMTGLVARWLLHTTDLPWIPPASSSCSCQTVTALLISEAMTALGAFSTNCRLHELAQEYWSLDAPAHEIRSIGAAAYWLHNLPRTVPNRALLAPRLELHIYAPW